MKEGWIQLPDGRVAVPQLLGAAVVLAVQETTHQGQLSLEKLLGWYFYISRFSALAKTVRQRFVTCRQHDARQDPAVPPGIRAYGAALFEGLQVDFTEMPKCGDWLRQQACVFGCLGTEDGKGVQVTQSHGISQVSENSSSWESQRIQNCSPSSLGCPCPCTWSWC
ncbi:uncharacterized protein LOC100991269 isoform X2 [Pan paniscus]|uniref:uncharacterized protein LOC100991269 isoform X2 n=1 Tax=Pan paniscus TaxID=9597 RepID=UPI0024367E7E|nr:uncharacterized protein LOC100991269 isoform X2 [Pan paniscus]